MSYALILLLLSNALFIGLLALVLKRANHLRARLRTEQAEHYETKHSLSAVRTNLGRLQEQVHRLQEKADVSSPTLEQLREKNLSALDFYFEGHYCGSVEIISALECFLAIAHFECRIESVLTDWMDEAKAKLALIGDHRNAPVPTDWSTQIRSCR